MSEKFQDLELAILREAVDKAEQRSGRALTSSPEIKNMIQIVEEFLRSKKLICYGGTAINNILPTEYQFYDNSVEITDYYFFSMNALEDAKELADIYAKAGYEEIEAMSGVHKGTYKVFVNYVPVADITFLEPEIFNNLWRDSLNVLGIRYAAPNFLRMAMYLELSRPAGDVSRWEKVLKRLTLLNKNYPLRGYNCAEQDFQRDIEDLPADTAKRLFHVVRGSLIRMGVVFFGGFANSLYARYMPTKQRRLLEKTPDFDVLAEDPELVTTILKERLKEEGFRDTKIIKHEALGELIAPHYEVRVGKETICFVYEPLACHSYNTLVIKRNKVKVATIDTMLSFYLAFLYSDRKYYDDDRILCMCEFLFKVQQKNRLEQKGLLRRFSINCYGKQHTLMDSRAEKANMYAKLKNKRNSREYEEWFMRYVPEPKTKTREKALKIENKSAKNTKSKTQKNRKKLDSESTKNKGILKMKKEKPFKNQNSKTRKNAKKGRSTSPKKTQKNVRFLERFGINI